MGTGPEHSEAFENLEQVVIPFVERSLRERRPLFFEPEHMQIMRAAFVEAGVNYDLNAEQHESLMYAPHTRLRVKTGEGGLVTGVQIYDRTRAEKEMWVDFTDTTRIEGLSPQMFIDPDLIGKEHPFADRCYGFIAAVGVPKAADLVRMTYQSAVTNGFTAKIGGHPGTEGRGGLQQATDLLRYTFLPETPKEEFNLNLLSIQVQQNVRLKKGILKVSYPDSYKMLKNIWGEKREPTEEEWTQIWAASAPMNELFTEDRVPNPSRKTSSFPPQTLPNLIRFMATRK